jgi:hypothetical protein
MAYISQLPDKYPFSEIGDIVDAAMERAALMVRIDTEGVEENQQSHSSAQDYVHSITIEGDGMGPSPEVLRNMLLAANAPQTASSNSSKGTGVPNAHSRIISSLHRIGPDALILTRSIEHGSWAALASRTFQLTHGASRELIVVMNVLPPSDPSSSSNEDAKHAVQLLGDDSMAVQPPCWRDALGRFGPYASWAALTEAAAAMPLEGVRFVVYGLDNPVGGGDLNIQAEGPSPSRAALAALRLAGEDDVALEANPGERAEGAVLPRSLRAYLEVRRWGLSAREERRNLKIMMSGRGREGGREGEGEG